MRLKVGMFVTAGLLGYMLPYGVQAMDLHDQSIGGGASSDIGAYTSTGSAGSSFKNPDRALGDAPVADAYWKKALTYRDEGRFELARQQYLLALSSCHTEEAKTRVQRELQSVELLIRTMR